jgi:hypothetical protein
MDSNAPAPTVRDGQSVAALDDGLRGVILRGELEPE